MHFFSVSYYDIAFLYSQIPPLSEQISICESEGLHNLLQCIKAVYRRNEKHEKRSESRQTTKKVLEDIVDVGRLQRHGPD